MKVVAQGDGTTAAIFIVEKYPPRFPLQLRELFQKMRQLSVIFNDKGVVNYLKYRMNNAIIISKC